MSASNDSQTQTGSQLESWTPHRIWNVVSLNLESVYFFLCTAPQNNLLTGFAEKRRVYKLRSAQADYRVPVSTPGFSAVLILVKYVLIP